MKFCTIFLLVITSFMSLAYSKTDLDFRWKKIVPLVSTCEDVKRILEVEVCNSPATTYKFPEYLITLGISSGKDDYNVKEGTVLYVLVNFTETVELDDLDFEKDLSGYRLSSDYASPENDIYINDEKRIEIVVWEKIYIRSIHIKPPKIKTNLNQTKKIFEWEKIILLETKKAEVEKWFGSSDSEHEYIQTYKPEIGYISVWYVGVEKPEKPICRNVLPLDTVKSFYVSLHKSIPISEFGFDLKSFKREVGHIEEVQYRSPSKGISFSVEIREDGEEFVYSIDYYPSTKEMNKKCGSHKKVVEKNN